MWLWHGAWDQGQLPENSFHPGPPGPCFLLIKKTFYSNQLQRPKAAEHLINKNSRSGCSSSNSYPGIARQIL